MTVSVGIIAEDRSDVDVVDAIISKCAKRKYEIKSFVGNGCGKVRNKCSVWAENLKDRNCKLLILVHDLDSASLAELRVQLSQALGNSPIRPFIIVIPVREIEAWLLADTDAISDAFNIRPKIKKIPNPEGLQRPKEALRDLIYRASNKKSSYLNTVHNGQIARRSNISNFRRCQSFVPLEGFLTKYLAGR